MLNANVAAGAPSRSPSRLPHRACFELLTQPHVSRVLLGHHHQATGALVQAVHNAGAQYAGCKRRIDRRRGCCAGRCSTAGLVIIATTIIVPIIIIIQQSLIPLITTACAEGAVA